MQNVIKPNHAARAASGSKRRSYSAANIFFYIFSAVLFLFVIYYLSDIEREVILLEKVKIYWLMPAIAAQLATYLVNALIYQILIKGYKIEPLPGLGELFRISVISLFFNQTVPSANISGNTFIFNYLLQRKISGSRVISIIALELLLFYIAMAAYCLFFLGVTGFFFPVPPVLAGVLSAGFVVYIVFITAILLIAKRRPMQFVLRELRRISFLKKYVSHFQQQLEHAERSANAINLLSFIYRHKKTAAAAGLAQLLAIALDAITVVFLFYGLGATVSLFVALLVLVGTRVVAILPISPGSLIVFESSMVYFFNSMGVALGVAVMVTLLFRLLSFWLPMPAGFILYRKWTKHSPG